MSQKHELIYHPIRGLGSPCRAAFIFNGVDFTDSQVRDWWEKDGTKARVSAKLPFCNLPSLILPSGEAITQTATILRYIGSLGETKPKNIIDEANISQVIDHLIEFNQEKFKMAYGEGSKENVASFFECSIPYYFGTLDTWINQRKTEFIATDYLSVADIFFAEFADSFVKLKQSNEWLKAHPKLFEIYHKVIEHDKLKAYYESVKNQPHNNPTYATWF
jgi:glutathione S-transferase